MTASFVALAAGMALLVIGGRLLVEGASQLARGLGVSELTVALTVVAFGTSAPELAVNVTAAIEGNTEVAFGNIIGSNVANIALVLGACALVRPLIVSDTLLSREIPVMLLATTVAVALGLDLDLLTGGRYGRNDGLVLLVLFAVFMTRTVAGVLWVQTRPPLDIVADTIGVPTRPASAGVGGLRVAGGLGGLLLGAQVAVDGAVGLAEALAVPSTVIGLTVLAFGTSLPELATSLVASARGQTDLAVGNVVGSNVFNLLFVLGSTAAIRPVEVPSDGGVGDLTMMGGVAVTLFLFAFAARGRIPRWQGALLLASYVAYVTVRYTI